MNKEQKKVKCLMNKERNKLYVRLFGRIES